MNVSVNNERTIVLELSEREAFLLASLLGETCTSLSNSDGRLLYNMFSDLDDCLSDINLDDYIQISKEGKIETVLTI